MGLADTKIPNLKHQITNKSQCTIINDQNNHHRWFELLLKLRFHAIIPSRTTGDRLLLWNFEFGVLEFVCHLVLGICYFRFFLLGSYIADFRTSSSIIFS